METARRIEQTVSRVLEGIVTFLFFGILSLTIILVFLRYGLNTTIIGGSEAMNYLFIYTTALGSAISVGKDEHIKITVLVDKLKGPSRMAVRVLNLALVGFINGVMIWYSLPWIRAAGYFESPVLRIPNWMVQISVPVGCGLVILYCLNHIFLEIFDLTQTEAIRGNS